MAFDPTRVQAIFFDLDGTLADTDDQFIHKAGEAIRKLSFLFPKSNPEQFLRWSLMVSETPMNLLAGLPDWLGVDDEIFRLFHWLSQHGGPKAQKTFWLMDGIDAMLKTLSGHYPLGVVTARPEPDTLAFLDQFNLRPYFRVMASALTAPHTKPYPDPVLWAAQQLNLPPTNCLMVGDTTVDILSGQRAGAQTVGVLCGFGERKELEAQGASLVLERTALLTEFLRPPDPPPPAAQSPMP
jgi:HAD superfamily hydrolase (TIGR01549 family)